MPHPFDAPPGAKVIESTHMGGPHVTFTMPNGYGASVICTRMSYGGDQGLWELAVLGIGGGLDYSTPITSDVEGWLTEADVSRLLADIAALPVEVQACHADRALTDLEKAQAELDHVLTVLGTRLRPVTAVLDVPDGDGMVGADPSPRSPLVRSLITARERTQRQTRLVLEITEGLDI